MYLMEPYDDALAKILRTGSFKPDRTGTCCYSIAGMSTRYSLQNAFPLISRRRIWPRAIFAELIWFLSGSTNTLELNRLGSRIWDSWRDEAFEEQNGYAVGDLGPIYGHQLRRFGADYKDNHSQGFDKLNLVDYSMCSIC